MTLSDKGCRNCGDPVADVGASALDPARRIGAVNEFDRRLTGFCPSAGAIVAAAEAAPEFFGINGCAIGEYILRKLRYRCLVSSRVGRFDDWLNDFLEECARNAGLDVPTYVARSVASQMLADLRRAESHSLDELVTRLSDSGVFADSAMPSTSAALTNPERLRALYATGLLDSAPEELYDRITKAAADALDAPSAAVSLIEVDRQFFKSSFGMGITNDDQRQTPIDRSMCQYAVADGTSLILEDARLDPVFKNHPVVLDGSVVAYLGIPLMDNEGNAIGTLCVFDDKPRLWGTGHVQILQDLADLTAERIFKSSAKPRR